MSRANGRVLGRVRRTRLVSAIRRIRKPRVLRPLVAGLTSRFRAGKGRAAQPAGVAPRFGRSVPAWSMLILLLLGVGVGFYASTIISQVTGTRASSSPDFTVGSVPGSLSISQGQIGSFLLSLDSLNGFAGSVDLNVTSRPSLNATFALNPGSVSLFTGSATATLTIPVPANAPLNDYLLAVNAASGKLTHTVTLILQVTAPPPPDFQLQAQQSTINVTRGSSGSMAITLTSVGGFSGMVNVTSSISPGGGSSPMLTLNPTKVTLLSGGTASVLLTINTTGFTASRSYLINVQGVSGSLSNTVSIRLTVL